MKLTKNKTIKTNFEIYKRKDQKNIWQVYKNPSYNKVRAWLWCEDFCKKYKGEGLSVINFNTCFFSIGFTYTEDNKKYFVYHTAYKTEKMEI